MIQFIRHYSPSRGSGSRTRGIPFLFLPFSFSDLFPLRSVARFGVARFGVARSGVVRPASSAYGAVPENRPSIRSVVWHAFHVHIDNFTFSRPSEGN